MSAESYEDPLKDPFDDFSHEGEQEEYEPEEHAVESTFSGAREPIGMSVLTGEPPPPPPVLVPGMIPMTVHSIVAPGGTAKTTIILLCMILLVVGRMVFGKKPAERGPCLFVTAEDDLAMVTYRIRSLCDAEGLSDAERKLVAEQLYIEDVSGKPVRLAELDARGNIVPSGHVDSLISKYKDAGIRWTVFDPANLFSAGERFVNDSEAALMMALRAVSIGLGGVAVGVIGHTGQAAAREKVVDQYAGRGGSAFSDNSRATLVMAFHGGGKEDELYPPPAEVSQADVDAGRVVRLHIAKFNAGRRETRPVWIVRSEQDPFKFDFYEGVSNTPQDRAARKAATEKADDEAAISQLWHYTRDLEAKGLLWGKTMIADEWRPTLRSGAACGRNRVRAIVTRALLDGVVVLKPLPADERRGAKKEYLAPGTHPKEQERRNGAE